MKSIVQRCQAFTVVCTLLATLFSSSAYAVKPATTVLVSDEQAFLAAIRANVEMLSTKSSGWKKSSSGGWQLFTSIAYGNKNENVMLVANPNPSNPNEFLLVTYRNVDGQWMPRYGVGKSGGPLAIAAFGNSVIYQQSPTYGSTFGFGSTGGSATNIAKFRIFYIDPTNVIDALKNSKSLFTDNRDEQINIYKTTAQQTLVSKDVFQRNLVDQILHTSSPSKKYPTEGIPKTAEKLIDIDSLTKKTSEFIVRGAIQGRIAFSEVFEGVHSRDEWTRFFASSDSGIQENIRNSVSYKRLVKDEVAKSQVIGTRFHIIDTTELETFNNQIKSIQDVCKTFKTDTESKHNDLGTVPMIHEDETDQNAINKYTNYISTSVAITQAEKQIANTVVKTSLDYITLQSPLAVLWSVENFDDTVGHFTADDCVNNGASVDIHPVSIASMDWAEKTLKEKFASVISNHIRQMDQIQKHISNDVLKRMIRSAPLAVKSALEERKVVQETNFIAQDIAGIYASDQFHQTLDYSLMGAGVAAGFITAIATGGAAAASMPWVMGAVDAVSLLRGASQAYNAYRLDGLIRGSMAAGTIDRTQGQTALEQNAQDKKSGLLTAGMTVGGNVVGYGIGKMVQGSKTASSVAIDVKSGSTIPKNIRVLAVPATVDEINDFNSTIQKAESTLGHSLTDHERSVIWNAHVYQGSSGGKIQGTLPSTENYPTNVNAVKLKMVTEDGQGTISMLDAKRLADAGVIGKSSLEQIVDLSEVKLQTIKQTMLDKSRVQLGEASFFTMYNEKSLVGQYLSSSRKYYLVKGYTINGDLVVEGYSDIAQGVRATLISPSDVSYVESNMDTIAAKAPWFGIEKRAFNYADQTTWMSETDAKKIIESIGLRNLAEPSIPMFRTFLANDFDLLKLKKLTTYGIDHYLQRDGHYVIVFQEGKGLGYGRIATIHNDKIEVVNVYGQATTLSSDQIQTAGLVRNNEFDQILSNNPKMKMLSDSEPGNRTIVSNKDLQTQYEIQQNMILKNKVTEVQNELAGLSKDTQANLNEIESITSTGIVPQQRGGWSTIRIKFYNPSAAETEISNLIRQGSDSSWLTADFVKSVDVVKIDSSTKTVTVRYGGGGEFAVSYADPKKFQILEFNHYDNDGNIVKKVN